jgi:hypothetical protein
MTALPSFTVRNWLSTNSMTAKACDYTNRDGVNKKLVSLLHGGGSLHLQFDMTPEGARSLADALHACANALEQEVMEVGCAAHGLAHPCETCAEEFAAEVSQ